MERKPRTRLELVRPLVVVGLASLVPLFTWLTTKRFPTDVGYIMMPPEGVLFAVISSLLALVAAAACVLTALYKRRWIETALLAVLLFISPTFAFGLGFMGTATLSDAHVTASNGADYRVLYEGFMDVSKTMVREESYYLLFGEYVPVGNTLFALGEPTCLNVEDQFESIEDDAYLVANADRTKIGMSVGGCPVFYLDVKSNVVYPLPDDKDRETYERLLESGR